MHWHARLSFFLLSRRQQEAELKLIEEETAKRVEAAIQKRVKEILDTEEIRIEIQRRLEEGRKKLFEDVAAQLQKEKETALSEARQKEVGIFYKGLFPGWRQPCLCVF